jgi:hypothetical protein
MRAARRCPGRIQVGGVGRWVAQSSVIAN